MSNKRSHHASCLLGKDKWWISGGLLNGCNTSEYLQTGHNTFEPFVELPEKFSSHIMVQINGTAVIFIGNNPPSKRVYLFNAQTEQFERLEDLKNARWAPFAGMLYTVQCRDGQRSGLLLGG